ncbi:MAG: hypothetical protein CL624_03935 [Arcobacter sp.]|nr:hypothetical protein [Arcobacter sp.]
MTKQIDILSSETKNTTTSSSNNINKEVKQEASLFDKLLGSVAKDSSTEIESSTPDKNINKEVSTLIKKDIETSKNLENKENINSDTKNEKSSLPTKSTSLLDRLVLESKKQTNENDSSTNKEVTKSEIKAETKVVVEKTLENKNSVDIVKKDISKTTEDLQVKQMPQTKELSQLDNESQSKIVTQNDSSINKEIDKEEVKPEIKVAVEKTLENKTEEKVENKNTVDIVKKDISNTTDDLQLRQTPQAPQTSSLTPVSNIEESSILTQNKVDTKNTEVVKTNTSENLDDVDVKQPVKSNLEIEKVNEKVNITKAEIDSLDSKQKSEPKSLMDSLLEKTKVLSKNESTLSQEESKTLKNSTSLNNTKDVISNIYLSSQRNNISNNELSNKVDAINSVKNATTTVEVEASAKKLDLNINDISLETKAVEIKKEGINLIDRKNSLDKIILNKNARHNEVNSLITKSVEASKVILDDMKDVETEVNLNVNPTLAQNIQAKIIGARQQMSSMMSEVARQMYENYKPPVTAFRINLTPGNLGSIAIIMKSDKDSGLNISLNMSNSTTLDAFIDSQNSLRSALNKTFEEGTEFNLEFSSNSDQNSNQSDDKEDKNQTFNNQSDTQSILESREQNLESEDRNLDYM